MNDKRKKRRRNEGSKIGRKYIWLENKENIKGDEKVKGDTEEYVVNKRKSRKRVIKSKNPSKYKERNTQKNDRRKIHFQKITIT